MQTKTSICLKIAIAFFIISALAGSSSKQKPTPKADPVTSNSSSLPFPPPQFENEEEDNEIYCFYDDKMDCLSWISRCWPKTGLKLPRETFECPGIGHYANNYILQTTAPVKGGFEYDGYRYGSAEACFQCRKFGDGDSCGPDDNLDEPKRMVDGTLVKYKFDFFSLSERNSLPQFGSEYRQAFERYETFKKQAWENGTFIDIMDKCVRARFEQDKKFAQAIQYTKGRAVELGRKSRIAYDDWEENLIWGMNGFNGDSGPSCDISLLTKTNGAGIVGGAIHQIQKKIYDDWVKGDIRAAN